jgi:uncharacterized protein (TIGR03435 family)
MKQRSWALIFATCCCAAGQTNVTLSFDVASVKPHVAAEQDGRSRRVGCSGGPGSSDPGQLTCNAVTLSALALQAYHLQSYQYAAPAWMDEARFDIVAKIPPGATPEQFRLMEQQLLAERFELKSHRESREVEAYVMTVGKNGPKFQASSAEPPQPRYPRPGDQVEMDEQGFPKFPPGRPGMALNVNREHWRAVNETMEDLSAMLSGQLRRPVMDQTSLAGQYDVDLKWILYELPRPQSDTASEPSGPTLIDAVQTQLGLKLEQKKQPVDVMVVDSARKAPIEN